MVDFWRMIWQEEITHIVMLTCVEERGKVSILFLNVCVGPHNVDSDEGDDDSDQDVDNENSKGKTCTQ